MMALANLLEHPTIKPDLIEGSRDKRSNKDLGRALAIARLSLDADLETWAPRWLAAVQNRFPDRWRELALHAGDGIGALLASPQDLQQAAEITNRGILATKPVNEQTLRATAEQLLTFVVTEIEALAKAKPRYAGLQNSSPCTLVPLGLIRGLGESSTFRLSGEGVKLFISPAK